MIAHTIALLIFQFTDISTYITNHQLVDDFSMHLFVNID